MIGTKQYALIASGTTVAQSAFLTGRLSGAALVVPAITSGQMIVQGSVDETLYTRAQNQASSGDLAFATGPGSKCVVLTDVAQAFTSIRLESSVTLTAPVTLTLWSKP